SSRLRRPAASSLSFLPLPWLRCPPFAPRPFLLPCARHPLSLHSFPTRRSSDLRFSLRDVSFKKGNAVFMLGFELCAGIRINIDSYDFGSTLSQHFRYRATNTGSATCHDNDFIFELHTWFLSWFYWW